MLHRHLEFHNPLNPDCAFDPTDTRGGDEGDWCSCPIPEQKEKFKMIPGEMFRYKPSSNWCRHGVLIVDKEGRYAYDTYQGLNPFGCDYGIFDMEAFMRLQDVTRFGNINDFTLSNRYEYEQYKKEDQFWIPTGMRSEMFFVRTGAVKDFALCIQQQEEIIRDSESRKRSMDWRIKTAENEIRLLHLNNGLVKPVD